MRGGHVTGAVRLTDVMNEFGGNPQTDEQCRRSDDVSEARPYQIVPLVVDQSVMDEAPSRHNKYSDVLDQSGSQPLVIHTLVTFVIRQPDKDGQN